MVTTKKGQDVARIWAFIEDACVVDSDAVSAPADLYHAYSLWASHRGIDAVSKVQLGHLLHDMGFRRTLARGGPIVRLGLALREAVR